MSITQVGSATTDSVNNGDTVTADKPTGVTEDDVLVAALTQNENSINPPSGFTLLREVTGGETTNTWSAHVYYKICGSSEPSDYTFTHNGGTAAPFVVVLSAWRGVDTANVINASAESSLDSASEPRSGPTVTTTANTRRIYIRAVREETSPAITFSSVTSGWTELAEEAGTSSGSARYSVCQYARDADDPAGSNLTTAAVTASGTETHNGLFHIALTATGITGTSAITAPPPEASASGLVGDSPSGTVTATAPSAQVSISGDVVHSGPLAVTAPAPTASMTGNSDQQFLTVTAPSAQADVSGLATAESSLSITAPSVTMLLSVETRIFGERVVVVENDPASRVLEIPLDAPRETFYV